MAWSSHTHAGARALYLQYERVAQEHPNYSHAVYHVVTTLAFSDVVSRRPRVGYALLVKVEPARHMKAVRCIRSRRQSQRHGSLASQSPSPPTCPRSTSSQTR